MPADVGDSVGDDVGDAGIGGDEESGVHAIRTNL